ncbi:MAG: hypothetical protein ACI9MU_001675, partial [Alphaproteobacteria bacterium]
RDLSAVIGCRDSRLGIQLKNTPPETGRNWPELAGTGTLSQAQPLL